MAKKNKKETTVVMTIEATFIFKDGKVPEGYTDVIDLSGLVPDADKVDLKNIKVFERE